MEWFPWAGTRVLLTLELCAKADGLATERGDLHLRYRDCSPADFDAHRWRIAGGAFTPERLLPLVADPQRDRFDEHVPEALLRQSFGEEVLDLPGAEAAAREGSQSC